MAKIENTDLTVNINVSTKLTVDERTFYTCLQLLNSYGLQEGLKGMVLRFDDNSYNVFTTPVIQTLRTEEDVRQVMMVVGLSGKD